MNKIVLQVGLLVFSLSLIYFGQRNISFIDVLVKSFVMFVSSTTTLAVITIIFMKSINKISSKKREEIANNLNRK